MGGDGGGGGGGRGIRNPSKEVAVSSQYMNA